MIERQTERRVSFRWKPIDDEAIESAKERTGQATINKVLLYMLHRYPGVCDRLIAVDAELAEAKKELGHCRRVLQNYTQSLNQLHGLADKLVNDNLDNGGQG